MTTIEQSLVDALEAFLAKLAECEPHITRCFLLQFARSGQQYSGPNFAAELNTLKAALHAYRTQGEEVAEISNRSMPRIERLALNLRAYAYTMGAPRRESDEEFALRAAREIIVKLDGYATPATGDLETNERKVLREQTELVDRLLTAIERAEQDIGGETPIQVLSLLGPVNDKACAIIAALQSVGEGR